MTEAEWLECADPDRLLGFLDRRSAPPRGGLLGLLLPRPAGTGEGLSRRKLTLFACACCRRIGHLLTDESRRAMEALEEGVGWPLGDLELFWAAQVAKAAVEAFAPRQFELPPPESM